MSADDILEGQRWIVVADSPFLPAHGGGEVEHLGFVRACAQAGVLAGLVIPTDADAAAVGREDDLPALRALASPAPVFFTPRRRTAWSALAGRRPYPVASRPVPNGLVRDVQVAVSEATAVVGFSYRAHRVAGMIAEGLELPGVLRMHNLEGRYVRALADARFGVKRWLYHAEAARTEADERRLEAAGWVRGIADISLTDARERQVRTTTPVIHVPTFALAGQPLDSGDPWRPPATPTVLFLGALDVVTNHEALFWFCGDVWPLVQRRVPGAVLTIAGRRPAPAVQALVRDTAGVELHADVADPKLAMRGSSVAINPAVSGSGVNIKLVEYLASGVPVVSTTLGSKGLSLRPEHDLLVRDDAAGFADAVTGLLLDVEAASRIGASGRAAAADLCDPRVGLRAIAALIAGRPAPELRAIRGKEES
ncbi:MAG: glycosyltransferase family 4 protein [Actinobacteria bacterium]|nr:glycosyltransferase family 4 protein [Actinomycetota bacterium]